MSFTQEDFEAQKRRRFAILYVPDVPDTVPGYQGTSDYGYCVCEMSFGVPVRYVGDDVCEPEDKLLARDLAWVADALNEETAKAFERGVLEGRRFGTGYILNPYSGQLTDPPFDMRHSEKGEV